MALGTIVAFLVAAWPVYSWVDRYVIYSPGQAADFHAKIILAMNEREVDRVRALIDAKHRLIVQTKYRIDINDQAKDELIATYLEEIRILKNKETCLLRGELNC